MLPIPLIGILILFHSSTGLTLSAKKVSQFAQISLLVCLTIYFLLSMFSSPENGFHSYHSGRLKLFSGNPIPFSFVILGLSIFCITDWKNTTKQNKLTSLLFFLIGIYFAGFLSGTRGTLLTVIIISPFIIFYLTNSLKVSIFIVFVSTVISFLVIKGNFIDLAEVSYFGHIVNGLETIVMLKEDDSSIFRRIEMWSAAIKAVSDAPFFGYGITERFSALRPHLQGSLYEYTHPHNDTLASIIASGFLGGIAATISITSGFLAALFTPNWNSAKVLLGLIVSLAALVTASVSTVFFNDISSAWLAFSAYLIWATEFNGDTDNQIR